MQLPTRISTAPRDRNPRCVTGPNPLHLGDRSRGHHLTATSATSPDQPLHAIQQKLAHSDPISSAEASSVQRSPGINSTSSSSSSPSSSSSATAPAAPTAQSHAMPLRRLPKKKYTQQSADPSGGQVARGDVAGRVAASGGAAGSSMMVPLMAAAGASAAILVVAYR